MPFAVLAIALGAIAPLPAKPAVKVATTASSTYDVPSPEAIQVLHWLEAHPGFRGPLMATDIASIGNPDNSDAHLSVTRQETQDGLAPFRDTSAAPLPPSGTPGRVVTVKATDGSHIRSWTYHWVGDSPGNGWTLTDYENHDPISG